MLDAFVDIPFEDFESMNNRSALKRIREQKLKLRVFGGGQTLRGIRQAAEESETVYNCLQTNVPYVQLWSTSNLDTSDKVMVMLFSISVAVVVLWP